MPESSSPLTVRLSSRRLARLHKHTQPRAGDVVLIEHRGRRLLARLHQGRYLGPSGYHDPQECQLLGVVEIP